MHSTLYPGKVGVIIAKFVFPQAEGKAAAMYRLTPFGAVIPIIFKRIFISLLIFQISHHFFLINRQLNNLLPSPPLLIEHLDPAFFLTSMCSASQPSRRAKMLPKRSAKHFLPNKEFPIKFSVFFSKNPIFITLEYLHSPSRNSKFRFDQEYEQLASWLDCKANCGSDFLFKNSFFIAYFQKFNPGTAKG